MAKLENNLYKKIGILGGTFDPAHKGHLAISKVAIKKFKLHSVVWAITKKNPFKNISKDNLKNRIIKCQKVIKKNRLIKVKYYEDLIKSNKTIDLINHLYKNKKTKLFFLIGADNLSKFHKWYNWKKIPRLAKIVVFPRKGFSSISLKSIVYKKLKKKDFLYINSKKVNISSSLIRKIW